MWIVWNGPLLYINFNRLFKEKFVLNWMLVKKLSGRKHTSMKSGAAISIKRLVECSGPDMENTYIIEIDNDTYTIS